MDGPLVQSSRTAGRRRRLYELFREAARAIIRERRRQRRERADRAERSQPSVRPPGIPLSRPLSAHELTRCRNVFERGAGLKDLGHVVQALGECGQRTTREEVSKFLTYLDFGFHRTAYLDFATFQGLLEVYKGSHTEFIRDPDRDTVEAFVALGGSPDRTGTVPLWSLFQACRSISLEIDVTAVLAACRIRPPLSGLVCYADFRTIFLRIQSGGFVEVTQDELHRVAEPSVTTHENGDVRTSRGDLYYSQLLEQMGDDWASGTNSPAANSPLHSPKRAATSPMGDSGEVGLGEPPTLKLPTGLYNEVDLSIDLEEEMRRLHDPARALDDGGQRSQRVVAASLTESAYNDAQRLYRQMTNAMDEETARLQRERVRARIMGPTISVPGLGGGYRGSSPKYPHLEESALHDMYPDSFLTQESDEVSGEVSVSFGDGGIDDVVVTSRTEDSAVWSASANTLGGPYPQFLKPRPLSKGGKHHGGVPKGGSNQPTEPQSQQKLDGILYRHMNNVIRTGMDVEQVLSDHRRWTVSGDVRQLIVFPRGMERLKPRDWRLGKAKGPQCLRKFEEEVAYAKGKVEAELKYRSAEDLMRSGLGKGRPRQRGVSTRSPVFPTRFGTDEAVGGFVLPPADLQQGGVEQDSQVQPVEGGEEIVAGFVVGEGGGVFHTGDLAPGSEGGDLDSITTRLLAHNLPLAQRRLHRRRPRPIAPPSSLPLRPGRPASSQRQSMDAVTKAYTSTSRPPSALVPRSTSSSSASTVQRKPLSQQQQKQLPAKGKGGTFLRKGTRGGAPPLSVSLARPVQGTKPWKVSRTQAPREELEEQWALGDDDDDPVRPDSKAATYPTGKPLDLPAVWWTPSSIHTHDDPFTLGLGISL